MCAFLNLPEGAKGTSTIETKTNIFRAAKSDVEAVARPLHIGGSTIVVQTDLFADGKRVAQTTQTQIVLR
ncbi:PaaI family thioesterase [Actinokineospora soli]|uniref:PaaI family thioesterase n=1 Tax=Actinokineospora soli TaxID=1048753 RepID=A0ABW2TKG8_9PSEU